MITKKKYLRTKAIKEFLYITVGCFLAALSFSVFLAPYKLVIGGVTGLSIVFDNLFPALPFSPQIIALLLNIVFIFLSLAFLGRKFTAKTLYGSLMFPVFAELIANLGGSALNELPNNLQDLFLVTLFSAGIMSVGIGLVFKYGASTGGTEIPQYIMLKYAKIPLSASLYLIDGLVVALGPIITIVRGEPLMDIDKILYGILFIMISGYIMDIIVFGGFNVRTAYIITSKPQEIKKHVMDVLERGVTEIYTRGGYSERDNMMLMCVLSTREYYYLRSIITDTDPQAFVFVVKASEVLGEGFTYERYDIN